MSGLPFDSHQLLHNGKVLSGRPLTDYGVHKGSVLELVPYEPWVPQPMPQGSPLLSSPDHELVGLCLFCSQYNTPYTLLYGALWRVGWLQTIADSRLATPLAHSH